ncbi:MAG TPA: F0F1 ATP synthase subunit epsilon [Candidatus Limnocylindrales bacterium]|jgi:F-type H+-transporting ATPase subunit epsilon|nr:F0F1 ATP synthase subunit epsilon [Candidatus Limnocylindrales bacterium]
MASTLKLEIVTPDAQVYSEDVEMVTLPGVEGEMGIYPQHVPLLTQVVSGELIARKDGRDYSLAVGEGFVEITAERVAIMTDMAIRAENIDEAKAEEARRRAETRLAEQLDEEETAIVSAALAHSLAQLKVKRRRK